MAIQPSAVWYTPWGAIRREIVGTVGSVVVAVKTRGGQVLVEVRHHEISHGEVDANTRVAARTDRPCCDDGREGVSRNQVSPRDVDLRALSGMVPRQEAERPARLEVVGVRPVVRIGTVLSKA